MTESQTMSSWMRPSFQRVCGTVVLAPILLIGCLIAGLVVVGVEGFVYVSEWRFSLRMRRAGRFLRLPDARQRIAAVGGSLIIELPARGFRHTRAWWTPDDVTAGGRFSEPTDEDEKNLPDDKVCSEFDQWCWDQYVSPRTGRAFLLRSWNGRTFERKLRSQYTNLNIFHTLSAWPSWLEGARQTKTNAITIRCTRAAKSDELALASHASRPGDR